MDLDNKRLADVGDSADEFMVVATNDCLKAKLVKRRTRTSQHDVPVTLQ